MDRKHWHRTFVQQMKTKNSKFKVKKDYLLLNTITELTAENISTVHYSENAQRTLAHVSAAL